MKRNLCVLRCLLCFNQLKYDTALTNHLFFCWIE